MTRKMTLVEKQAKKMGKMEREEREAQAKALEADRQRVMQQYGKAEKKEETMDTTKTENKAYFTGDIIEFYMSGNDLRYIDKDEKTIRISKVRDPITNEVVKVYEKDEDGEETCVFHTMNEKTDCLQFIIQRLGEDRKVLIKVNPKRTINKTTGQLNEKSALRKFMEKLASQYDTAIDFERIVKLTKGDPGKDIAPKPDTLEKELQRLVNKGPYNFEGYLGEGYTKPLYFPCKAFNHSVKTHLAPEVDLMMEEQTEEQTVE